MSYVLGGIARYENASNVAKLARHESIELLNNKSPHNNMIRHNEPLRIDRGPRPKGLNNKPSFPSILSEAERRSEQYAQDLERGLRAVYGSKQN